MNSSAAQVTVSMQAEEWYPYFIALYVLIILSVTAGNGLTMSAYWTTPHLQTPSNLLIFNLSLVDSCVPYLCLPWMIFNYTETGLQYISRAKWSCLFWLWQSIASTITSMVAISALGLERIVAVLFPYRYYTLVTDSSVKIINVATWVVSFALTFPPLFDWNTWAPNQRCFTMYVYHTPFNEFLTIIRTIILVGTAAMNTCIAVVAVKKSKVFPVAGQLPDGEQGPQPAKLNFKLTKTLLTVVGVFYACWVPYIALTAIYTANGGNVSTTLRMSHDFAKLLIGVNSAVNPMIYAKGNVKYGYAYKKILGRIFGVHVNAPSQ